MDNTTPERRERIADQLDPTDSELMDLIEDAEKADLVDALSDAFNDALLRAGLTLIGVTTDDDDVPAFQVVSVDA